MIAEEIIAFIDGERMRQRVSQSKISERAGMDDLGQKYARMWGNGDGKISVCLKFLHALGYDIEIVKGEKYGEK